LKEISLHKYNDGRWAAKLVARLLVTAALWVRISQKYIMGDISKGVVNTLSPRSKNIEKMYRKKEWSVANCTEEMALFCCRQVGSFPLLRQLA
jgi:hypothetical protein